MLRFDIMQHYGLTRDFSQAGFYETQHHKNLLRQIQVSVNDGMLIALSGLVGSGKTTLLERLQDSLSSGKKPITVSKSLSVEKDRTTIPILICALFCDLSGDLHYKIPKQHEKRDRELQSLMAKKKIALFVDEAHDLHPKTLTGMKRLVELARYGQGTLSIILAGHPKLGNDLTGTRIEEIGYRTQVLKLDAMQGHLRDYITWLIDECRAPEESREPLITPEAIDYLAEKLRTPLQIQQHLRRAMEAAFTVGETIITFDLVQSILSSQIDTMEPVLIRNGYNDKVIADILRVHPAEIGKLMRDELEPARKLQLIEQMRQEGMPV